MCNPGWSTSPSGQSLDLGEGVGIVGQPGVDADPAGADGDEGVAAALEGLDADHAGHRADGAALVAATDLPPPLDQRHAELGVAAVVGEAVDDELAVPRFEHVQRQHGSRQEHAAEGNIGITAMPAPYAARPAAANGAQRGASWAGVAPLGYVASTAAKRSQIGRYTAWLVRVPDAFRINENSMAPRRRAGRTRQRLHGRRIGVVRRVAEGAGLGEELPGERRVLEDVLQRAGHAGDRETGAERLGRAVAGEDPDEQVARHPVVVARGPSRRPSRHRSSAGPSWSRVGGHDPMPASRVPAPALATPSS